MVETTPRVIALGFFDGVHIGHGALLSLCAQRAGELGCVPAAFTFDVRPADRITGAATPLLSPLGERERLMARYYGIREVIVAHYDEALMRTPWREFVTGCLVGEHGAVHLIAGHNFRFGYRGEGDAAKLQALCRALGLGCDIVPQVSLDGVPVSSTHIRALIARGEMARATALLGHPYALSGTVGHGKGLGGALGFPTVNLSLPAGLLLPARGVYAAQAALPGGSYTPAVVNVGVRPTVDDGEAVSVEGYLLDFAGDLYGQALRLDLYDYLRPERRFPSLEGLRAQVMADARQARAFFAGGEPPASPQ